MMLKVITQPSVEPITLEQARMHLKLTATGSPATHPEDDLIEAQITAAREWCENYLNYAIVEQELRLYLDNFPSGDTIALPRSNLISIESVTYYDTSGEVQTWDSGNYTADTASAEGRLIRNPDVDWPSTQTSRHQAVAITYKAGFPPSADSPPDYRANIPKSIIAAIKLLITDLYEVRQQQVLGATLVNTEAAKNMLHSYRRIFLR